MKNRIIEKNKIYRHFKGNVYKVLAIAKDSDNLEDIVVYQDIKDENKVWIRNYNNFNSYIDKNKYPNIKCKYLFEEIKDVKNNE